jgi:sugar lactone lactonase YvrE
MLIALCSAAPQSAAAATVEVTSGSPITTIAGNGQAGFAGDGGPAAAAQLNLPRDSAIGPDGSIYIADTYNNRVRKIAPDGTVSTVAGNGSQVYNGDNIPATSASLAWPHDVFVDANNVLYIADSDHHRVRSVVNGVIRTIAGTGTIGSTGDGGPAVQATLKNPKSVFAFKNYIYIAGLDDRVRRVNRTTGVIEPYVGTGVAGYSGDGGPALAAQIDTPQRIQIDSRGNLYIADTHNSAVRRVDGETRVITTVAGTGAAGLSGDGGPATSAQLDNPRGLALFGDTVLYVADSNNARVRKIDLVTGSIAAVAGTVQGDAGDGGPAGRAQLTQPRGLSVTPEGDLLVADTFNSRLRLVKAMPGSAIIFRATASVVGNATTAALAVPDAVQVGDTMIASFTQATPSIVKGPELQGWQQLAALTDTKGESCTTVWMKVAAADDIGGTVSVGSSTAVKYVLVMSVYGGVDQGSPVVTTTTAAETVSRTTHSTAAVSGVPSGAWIVSQWADKSSATTDWVQPLGQRSRIEAFAPGDGRVSVMLTDGARPVAGGTQPAQYATANSASAKAVMWTVVLRP